MKNTTKNQESEIGRLNRAIAELRTELDTASNRADVMFLRNEIRVLIYERDIAFHFSEEEF
jgi:signal transduction protein with GAF and PtsI domain